MPNLQIQKLFRYQQEVKDAPHQFKKLRWGRRTGKSRAALHMSTTGHGPPDPDHPDEPIWKGLAQGKNVLWIGPDYTQLATVWNEEIYPRFNGADGCDTNINETTAMLGDARLIMRTAKKENHKAMRGMGHNLGGVVIDEAAHLDLETLLTDVVLPMTLDEDGWIMFPSTPNAGSDTHITEDGAKRTPSYFNVLCEQQLAGELPGWFQSHHDARSNPKIKRKAFDRLVETYANQPLKLKQEVYALLLRGGVGFAFEELSEIHQLVKSPQKIRETVAGCDWGWSSHGYIGVLGLHHRGAHLEHEFPFNGPIEHDKRMDPERVGFECGREWLRAHHAGEITRLPEICYCDSQMDAITQGGLSQMALLQSGFDRAMGEKAPTCVPAQKGQGSRAARKSVMHTLLRHKIVEAENGMKVMVDAPRFSVSPRCPFFFRTTKQLMVDPKNIEDVDTTGPDHAYDAVTYAMVMVFPELTLAAKSRQGPRPNSDRLSAREEKAYDEATDPELIKQRAHPTQKVYG